MSFRLSRKMTWVPTALGRIQKKQFILHYYITLKYTNSAADYIITIIQCVAINNITDNSTHNYPSIPTSSPGNTTVGIYAVHDRTHNVLIYHKIAWPGSKSRVLMTKRWSCHSRSMHSTEDIGDVFFAFKALHVSTLIRRNYEQNQCFPGVSPLWKSK